MPAIVDRAKARLAEVRLRRPVVDHAIRTQEQYGAANASQQAGAVTYFGFLSVFPVLALAFFAVGYIARVYPDAQDNLENAIGSMFPGMIGSGKNQLQLSDIQHSAGTVGIIGLVGVLYSGLGWLSALRGALVTVFALPKPAQPGLVTGKIRDLATLVIIGTVLLVAVAVTGLVSGFSHDLLGWLGLSNALGWLVQLLTVVIGLAANALLFFAMFRLLAAPDLPTRSLWSGAALGAVGFEALKQLSTLLIRSTQGQPATQVFGLALILLVWINYFSRIVLYAAAWAWSAPAARALRDASTPAAEEVEGPPTPSIRPRPEPAHSSRTKVFAAGALAGAAATAAVLKGRGGADR